MTFVRKYGNGPYKILLLHGGPGAPGEMAPVARKLSEDFSILEPIQAATSLDGQIEELKEQIVTHAEPPVILVGWSWGAWLAYLFTARYPDKIQKLILISSGPFEDKYTDGLMDTRLSRLTESEGKEVKEILENMSDENIGRFGELMEKADSFDAEKHPNETLSIQEEVYISVWPEADSMRKSGKLLELAKDIPCPVVAIHGDHDPHPFVGVQKPLEKALKNFRFRLLEKCGHHPWYEKHAKDEFYNILREELS